MMDVLRVTLAALEDSLPASHSKPSPLFDGSMRKVRSVEFDAVAIVVVGGISVVVVVIPILPNERIEVGLNGSSTEHVICTAVSDRANRVPSDIVEKLPDRAVKYM